MLLAAGAKPDAKRKDGASALLLIVLNHEIDVLKAALKQKAAAAAVVNSSAGEGNNVGSGHTPLTAAVSRTSPELVKVRRCWRQQ